MNQLTQISNSTVVHPNVLKLIGGQDKWEELCLTYKEKLVQSKGRHKPQLVLLFKSVGLSERIYNQVIGLVGEKDLLHQALNRIIAPELNGALAVYNRTMEELAKRIPTMKDKELIELAKNMPNIMGNTTPATTQIQVNNGFSIDKHLADRGIMIDNEDISSER